MRNKLWDSMKGIGIIGVILAHFNISYVVVDSHMCESLGLPLWIGVKKCFEILNSNGAQGVGLFFIASTFFMCCSITKFESMNDRKKWWIKRLYRLVPMYYLFLVIGLIYYKLDGRYWSPNGVSWINILSHFFFINGFNPYYINSILGVEWYLADLFILILIMPTILTFINSVEKAVMLVCISFPTSSILGYILSRYSPIMQQYVWESYCQSTNLIAIFPDVAWGICLFYLLNLPSIKSLMNDKLGKNLSYAMLYLSFFVLAIFAIEKYKLEKFWFSMCFVLIIISQHLYISKIVVNKVFSFFGKHSYGIYLVHFILIDAIHKKYPAPNFQQWIAQLILILVLSLGISLCLEYWFERPIINYYLNSFTVKVKK